MAVESCTMCLRDVHPNDERFCVADGCVYSEISGINDDDAVNFNIPDGVLKKALIPIAETMIDTFNAAGAENYLELIFSQDEKEYSITVQNVSGVTPGEKCEKQEVVIKEYELKDKLMLEIVSNYGCASFLELVEKYERLGQLNNELVLIQQKSE